MVMRKIMTGSQEYKNIFEKEIIQKSKGVIFSYSSIDDTYKYQPYSHAVGSSAVEDLATLMRQNLLFYAFGEDEVVKYYNNGVFSSLEQAAKFAYNQRLPKRADINDGLLSEVLLDLLVQLYDPSAYKLAVRTVFRQNDNNEIKGYDLTYFSQNNEETTLWLGQAKLGQKEYCKSNIDKDLTEKYSQIYLSKQLFFVCDKRVHITEDAAEILELIEQINTLMIDNNDEARAKKLLSLFKEKKVKIKIPCLLAYGANTVYQDAGQLFLRIEKEVTSIKDYYRKKSYNFTGFNPEIVFYVFPIESIECIRDKEKGFYAGLYQPAFDGN